MSQFRDVIKIHIIILSPLISFKIPFLPILSRRILLKKLLSSWSDGRPPESLGIEFSVEFIYIFLSNSLWLLEECIGIIGYIIQDIRIHRHLILISPQFKLICQSDTVFLHSLMYSPVEFLSFLGWSIVWS